MRQTFRRNHDCFRTLSVRSSCTDKPYLEREFIRFDFLKPCCRVHGGGRRNRVRYAGAEKLHIFRKHFKTCAVLGVRFPCPQTDSANNANLFAFFQKLGTVFTLSAPCGYVEEIRFRLIALVPLFLCEFAANRNRKGTNRNAVFGLPQDGRITQISDNSQFIHAVTLLTFLFASVFFASSRAFSKRP